MHKVLQTYIRATRLVQKAYHERDDVKPKPQALTLERWLTSLKGAWTAAGLLLPEAEQPRYDRIEAGSIYREGTNGRHDPRYGLWLQLGMEGRPVQVLRARRSHLEDRFPDVPRGVFRGPGTRLKHGLVYAPTPAHRVEIDKYLDGYLRNFERAYQRGEIEDYPLFPAGVLGPDDVAPLRPNVRPWGYRQFLGDARMQTGFYAIEKAAGVGSVAGRGPYALKYTVADLVPQVAGRLGVSDPVVVNLATAHDTPGTAPRYRKQVRSQPSVLVEVGKILWGVRKELRAAGHAAVMEFFGFPAEPDRIRSFRVSEGGITVRTVKAERHLWIPWKALVDVGGQQRSAVQRLASDRLQWGAFEVDDEAHELRHVASGVVVRLEPLVQHAEGPEPPGGGSPEWRRTAWWD